MEAVAWGRICTETRGWNPCLGGPPSVLPDPPSTLPTCDAPPGMGSFTFSSPAEFGNWEAPGQDRRVGWTVRWGRHIHSAPFLADPGRFPQTSSTQATALLMGFSTWPSLSVLGPSLGGGVPLHLALLSLNTAPVVVSCQLSLRKLSSVSHLIIPTVFCRGP